MPLTLLKTLFPDIMAAPMPARKLWSTMRLPLNIRFSALLGMDIEAMARTLEETAAAPQRLGRSSKPRRRTIARLAAAAIATLSRYESAVPVMPRSSVNVSTRFSTRLEAFSATLTYMGRFVSPAARMKPQHWKYTNHSGGASAVKPK